VLHPGRRLPEKLVHIHALAQQLVLTPRGRPTPAAVEQIMASVEEVTRTYFRGNDDTELCPKDGFAASSAFDPGTDVSLRLRPAYGATMPELYSEADPLPR
jgi:virulence-associated protein VagC